MNTFKNKRELEEHVRLDKRVLVLFCASWCPFCQEFFPAFDRTVVEAAFGKTMRVYIDNYDNPLWEEFSIEAVPTAVLFENGKATKRLDARLGCGLSEKTFADWLKKHK
jgi:thioredoxin-like negative regulator of GroEL